MTIKIIKGEASSKAVAPLQSHDASITANKAAPPTLEDVARVAGVSPITVSRALNRPDVVSEKNRAKVYAAVEQVGYIPNMMAGGLATKQSKLVAIFVPTVAHTLFAEFVDTLTGELGKAGYQAILGVTGYDSEQEQALVTAILGRRPDGIVLTGTDHSPALTRRLKAANIPVVEAWDLAGKPMDMLVGFSHEGVGQLMANHILDQGYRNIAVLTAADPRGLRRLEAMKAVFNEQGIKAPIVSIMPPPASPVASREAMSALLSQHGTQIDAVLCSSDTVAQGVVAAVLTAGYQIPQQIAVMGFGDLSCAEAIYPSLSTVRIDGSKMGCAIAKALLRRFKGDQQEDEPLLIDAGFELIQRDST
ncbi:MAG: LacI family DNA-binding transcriptional regulator [Pontibacterium sp.]